MTRFWFAPTSPRPLALMRIGLALVLLFEVLSIAPYAIESYSIAGRPLPVFGVPSWLPELGPSAAVTLHGVLIGSLVCVALGLLTRTNLLLSFVLLTWFSLLDFPGTLTKYTAIALHLLLLLAAGGSHHVWSLDRRLLGPRDRTTLALEWPRRLTQLLVCHVYLGAAITKMRMWDFR